MKWSFVVFIIFVLTRSSPAQMAVFDGANQATSQANHAEELAQWAQSIDKATEQIQRLNGIVSQLEDVQGLIGKGMDGIGIPPEIAATIDLAKSVNNLGIVLQNIQHNASTINLDAMRQATTDPTAWERYVLTTRSYEATQRAQRNYDEEMDKLRQNRQQAQTQLRSAKSLGETQKAKATLDEIKAGEDSLDAQRHRAFEQQQANWIENQNQKDAWEQAGRDWTAKEMNVLGKSIDNFLSLDGKSQ